MNYPIKFVFVISDVVIGIATVWSPQATASGPAGSTEYQVSNETAVDVDWHVSGTPDAPVFTAP